MNSIPAKELYSERYSRLPSVNSLLKISLGLIFFTLISSALVYAESISVNVNGELSDIQYNATGMTVSGIISDTDSESLILAVDVPTSTGTLDITFDRSFFDSTYKGLDSDFIVFVDFDMLNYSEIATTKSRTLSLTLPVGSEEVEIFGIFTEQATPPVKETPIDETPVKEIPVKKDPVTDTLVKDTMVKDTMVKDTMVKDTMVKDTMVKDTMVKDTMVKDTPADSSQCGRGTVFKDGVCVLDSSLSSSSKRPLGVGLAMGFVTAFVVASIIAFFLAIVAKANKSS